MLAWAIGEKALEESLARFGAGSPLTRLRTELAGIDPDDAFSSIPYEKGARFVDPARARRRGASASTASCGDYMARFRFTSITTEEFLAFLEERAARRSPRAWAPSEWLYEPGLPANAPVFRSARLDAPRRPRRRPSPAASGRPPPQIAALEPGRDARLPPEPAARDRPRRAAPGSTRRWA